jgi:hypothetical protein
MMWPFRKPRRHVEPEYTIEEIERLGILADQCENVSMDETMDGLILAPAVCRQLVPLLRRIGIPRGREVSPSAYSNLREFK